MIEKLKEWSLLEEFLLSREPPEKLSNQFFNRLVVILTDELSGLGDVFTGYRDALKASPKNQASLPFIVGLTGSHELTPKKQDFEKHGLTFNELSKKISIKSRESGLSLEQIDDVYQLLNRRHLPEIKQDICLTKKLTPNRSGDNNTACYRGEGQQEAIRTALQSKPGSTIVINLPTGTGKTLVAHSLCLFAPHQQLTLVITPTIALAIEQAMRAKVVLLEAGESTHNNYFFGGEQTPQERQDIKNRIRSGQQRILFTSPESARGALLPSLFDAAKDQKLANIVIDEAHIVDQWGDEFRPDFQIFAAVTHALIKESGRTIKCVLMSATFTDANLATLKNLFTFDGHDFIEVHSSFLRPEPQYQVKQVYSDSDFKEAFKNALISLPRPLIVYTLERFKATTVSRFIKSLGFKRVKCFTGDTSTEQRTTIINKWNNDEIDIIVATSAFGVGMDKDNIRSVLHIQPPENIDRFYQEVGRSGRDGKASQSLIIFNKEDLKTAEKINKSTLISSEFGLKRWTSLFNHRMNSTDSTDSSAVNITNMHDGIARNSKANASWNWRTLLLMQRSGLINIEFKRPERAPQWKEGLIDKDFFTQEQVFYEQYYEQISITLLNDDHRSKSCWDEIVSPQRRLEINRRVEGHSRLRAWLLNPETVSLCGELVKQYTIKGCFPQRTCGGCPNCRSKGEVDGFFPTLSYPPEVIKPSEKFGDAEFVYYPADAKTTIRRLISGWGNWIQFLIENDSVLNIHSSEDTQMRLTKVLPIGMNKFWANTLLEEKVRVNNPSLIIIPPNQAKIPVIESTDIPYILLAPDQICSSHYGRLWWEDKPNSKSIEHFTNLIK